MRMATEQEVETIRKIYLFVVPPLVIANIICLAIILSRVAEMRQIAIQGQEQIEYYIEPRQQSNPED